MSVTSDQRPLTGYQCSGQRRFWSLVSGIWSLKMRLVLLLLAMAFASPALADYRAIMTALPGVLKDVYGSADVAKQDEDYGRKYTTSILDGIDGAYIPISLLGQADEAKFKQVCAGPAAVKITRQGNYRFSLVENYQGTTPVEYVYTYRLGNTFTF